VAAEAARDAAVAARDAAAGHESDAEAWAGQAADSEDAAGDSAEAAAESATDAAGHAAAADADRVGAEEARDAASVAAGASAGSAVEAAASALSTEWRRSMSARAALAPLLSPWDPGDPLSGPVALWLADHYTPGAAGAAGRYPNLAGTGAELDMLEPATMAARPARLPYAGERYVYLPGVNGNRVEAAHAVADATVTTEIDLIARVANFQPSAGAQTLMGKGSNGVSLAFWWRAEGTSGQLRLITSANGNVNVNASATAAPTTGFTGYLRCRWRGSDGRIQTHTSTDYDPVTRTGTWTQLGPDRIGLVGALHAPSAPLYVGAAENSSVYLGSLSYAEMRATDGGTAVATWRARDMGQTGGVSGGRTWTINRAAGAGAKAEVVDRTGVVLDGVDDYLEAPHDTRLDADGGVVSVVHVYRVWGAPPNNAILIGKTTGIVGPGWNINRTPARQTRSRTSEDAASATDTDGLTVVVGVWRPAEIRQALNGLRAIDASLSAPAVSDPVPLRIGRAVGSSLHAAQTWLGSAVFRRALSDSEIESLTNALLGRPNVQAERVDIDPVSAPGAGTGWGALGFRAGAASGVRAGTTDGTYVEWPITLSAGTWRIDVTHPRLPTGAIMRVSLDDVSLGTIDTYAASATENAVASITVSVASPGRKTLRVAVDGRNPANTTGWYAGLQRIALTRTA